MRKNFLFIITVVLLSAAISTAATDERPMLVRVDLTQPGAKQVLMNGNFDIATVSRNGQADIVANDADYTRLLDAGLNPVIIHDDLVAFYQSRMPLTTT